MEGLRLLLFLLLSSSLQFRLRSLGVDEAFVDAPSPAFCCNKMGSNEQDTDTSQDLLVSEKRDAINTYTVCVTVYTVLNTAIFCCGGC